MGAVPTRVLITGGAGLVGGHLVSARPGHIDLEVTRRSSPTPAGVRSHQVDLDRSDAFAELLDTIRPDVVVHTAYSVARREDIVDASRHVARSCADLGIELVHLSSDVVFDGESPPYAEHDPLGPVNDYGRWKAEAEQVVIEAVPDACITRTSLVVSLDPPDSGTRWLLDSARRGERPTLFRDEIRHPIRAADLARTLWALVALDRDERQGIWHLPGPEPMSRLELGVRLLRVAGLGGSSVDVGSVRNHPAPRPRELVLTSKREIPGPSPSAVP